MDEEVLVAIFYVILYLSWLRHYATSRNVACSIPVVIEIQLILPVALWSWDLLSLNRIEYQESSGRRGKGRPARKADNFTAICYLVV
jgi:hypothetical protein